MSVGVVEFLYFTQSTKTPDGARALALHMLHMHTTLRWTRRSTTLSSSRLLFANNCSLCSLSVSLSVSPVSLDRAQKRILQCASLLFRRSPPSWSDEHVEGKEY